MVIIWLQLNGVINPVVLVEEAFDYAEDVDALLAFTVTFSGVIVTFENGEELVAFRIAIVALLTWLVGTDMDEED